MTEEEYIKNHPYVDSFLSSAQGYDVLQTFMINFAKLKVKDALECAGEKAIEIQRTDNRKYVSKKAIINSYNLEDIK